MGQSDEGLRFRAAGTAVARAVGVGATANAQSEARDSVEGGDGAVFGVGGPKGMTALRAASSDRGKGLGLCGARPATSACHGSPSFCTFLLLFYGGSPPKFATLVFFNRTERDLGRCDHLVHVARGFRTRAGFGQETRDVQVGLPPRLLMHFAFDGGEARGVAHQTREPLRLAFAQHSSRLIRHGGRRGDRGAVRTTALTRARVPIPLFFRLDPHIHRQPSPCCSSGTSSAYPIR